MTSTAERLHTFVNFVKTHLTGDEKSEAPTFLDRFFRAFGHEGAIEAGATYEARIHKGSKKGKTGFADLVWKPRVLIEMKKRGADLSKHYSQAFGYWCRAVPHPPQYVMLCNFDEFWVYDFKIQIDTPIDTVKLEQLPERVTAFGFMELNERKSVFGNNQVEVTEKAAERMGLLYKELQMRLIKSRDIDLLEASQVAQRFVLQCVLAMFAEDRELLPHGLFITCVKDCLERKESSYDVLGGLFREMNTLGITPAGRFQGVDYFNGGLFAQIDPIDLTHGELKYLEVSALQNWSKVRPAIFGSIFESAIDTDERRAHGIHYTAEADIMKIVRPTISRYWEDRIEQANTISQLESLQLELQNYRVLDPACGSGNFLYIAYQELKQIEQDLLDKIAERRRTENLQIQMGYVTPLQFFGIDNNPFAVELARVTMMIARKVAIDKLNIADREKPLPLDTLDKNIVCEDALFTEWPKADAIIGNPPFLGGKYLKRELEDIYVERIYERFPDVKESVDFCVYWFRLAHQNLEKDGRAGLVGTNSIRQGWSRKAGLDYITQNDGTIHEAISTQVWSGEAKVHVSIANWNKDNSAICFLDNKAVSSINSSLRSDIDVTSSLQLESNQNFCFQGVTPRGKGFIISEEKAQEWISGRPKSNSVLKPLIDAGSLARDPGGYPQRWIIDFDDFDFEDASNYPEILQHLRETVKPQRIKIKDVWAVENWWKFWRLRSEMREAISKLESYFAIPRHSKWFIFLPAKAIWLPGDSTNVVATSDFFILGILTSHLHRIWIEAQSSTLKGDTRYTHNTCFETFPFPQTPTAKIVQQIRDKALELHEYRSNQMEQKQWGITKLYNAYFDEPASQLYKLHKQLDALVLDAYGFSPDDDLLEKLLGLNLELAEKEKQGEAVVGPWAPC